MPVYGERVFWKNSAAFRWMWKLRPSFGIGIRCWRRARPYWLSASPEKRRIPLRPCGWQKKRAELRWACAMSWARPLRGRPTPYFILRQARKSASRPPRPCAVRWWCCCCWLCTGGKRRGKKDDSALLTHLRGLPALLEGSLPAMRETATHAARTYAGARSFFYLGRGPSYPLALEGALKLKELSYIHAEGYAAGR